jgi:hypothetical protein
MLVVPGQLQRRADWGYVPSRNKTKLFSFFRYCFLCSWELEPVAAFIVHKDSPVETATNTRFYFELFVISGYRVSIELYLDTELSPYLHSLRRSRPVGFD